MGERIAKGGAFPLLVESTPLSWAVRSCFPIRAEGRFPCQGEYRLFPTQWLLGWCFCSPGFGPTCGASRPTGAGRRPLPPDLKAWWVAGFLLRNSRVSAAGNSRYHQRKARTGRPPSHRASCHADLAWWHKQEQQEPFRAVDMGRSASLVLKKGGYLGGEALGDSLVAFSSGRKPPCGANPSCLFGSFLQILDNPPLP